MPTRCPTCCAPHHRPRTWIWWIAAHTCPTGPRTPPPHPTPPPPTRPQPAAAPEPTPAADQHTGDTPAPAAAPGDAPALPDKLRALAGALTDKAQNLPGGAAPWVSGFAATVMGASSAIGVDAATLDDQQPPPSSTSSTYPGRDGTNWWEPDYWNRGR